MCTPRARVTFTSSRTIAPVLILFTITLSSFLLAADTHAQCPVPPTQIVETAVPAGLGGTSSAVAMDKCGRIVVAWSEQGVIPNTDNQADVLVRQYDKDGVALASPQLISANNPVPTNMVAHTCPSIAMSANGLIRVGWLARDDDAHPSIGPLVRTSDFPFGATPVPLGVPGGPIFPAVHFDTSVALSNSSGAVTWIGQDVTLDGVLQGPTETIPAQIRPCVNFCYTNKWRPSVAMRPSDSAYAIVWAESEDNALSLPPFNIALQIYNSSGTLLFERAGSNDQWVNNPSLETPLSSQLSPAVAFDDSGNVVVVWTGPNLLGCSGGIHVYARRFKFDLLPTPALRDPDPAQGEGGAGMFIVDSDPDTIVDSELGGPTVALKLYPGQNDLPGEDFGSFVVAWNTLVLSNGNREIRGQFFTKIEGVPRGGEVRLNQAAGTNGIARLARSGQHTLAYGADEQVAISWQQGINNEDVMLTLLPPGYWANGVPTCTLCQQDPAACLPCLKGDVNGDCLINGFDIQPFVDLMLGSSACLNIVDICPPDIDNSAAVDIKDVPGFVCLLLGVPCGQSGQRGGAGNTDCNTNGVSDATDIFLGTSQDCNANFIPDECDVDPADPDGDGQVSNDLNANSIPDECEPDCNSNGIPDDKDIADGTSVDLNTNGIPDECDPDCNSNGIPDEMDIDPADPDGNGQVSPDCNADGVPDECEDDCNANGVPDDCDVDPTDPDGNGQVSPDCNGNNFPDECDMALLPPFGSLDCNANGIPDECDIASGTSQDCNANGFPDECDIATGISQDANTNGVPDECEAQQSQGGGGSSPTPTTAASTLSESETERAYAEFYNWCLAQRWGPNAPRTCNLQFQAMVDKMRELGLPVRRP